MAKIYKNSSDAAEKYGMKTNGIPDYIVGADIAAFERVADGIAATLWICYTTRQSVTYLFKITDRRIQDICDI